MVDLSEAFERAKKSEQWVEEMQRLILVVPKCKCIVCFNESCTCVPGAGLTPWDCGTGV